MQSYIDDSNLDLTVSDFKHKEDVIHRLKKRFHTYGYQQIQTPAFEPYDLYSTVTGTINQESMIKVVDRTGQVLVLRPDITIPITRQVVNNTKQLADERRYFYVLDIFRHTFNQTTDYDQTQAGIEHFGNPSPEADAEVLSLACHLLQDLQITNFKIEIGDAGFFKEVLGLLSLSKEEEREFKQLIQAKNIPGLDQFLNQLMINPVLKNLIKEIPLLYGDPLEVLQRAKKISLTKQMISRLQALEEVISLLQAFQCDRQIVLDLGLINHMDYYSDMIFQGYIEGIARPVLTGGRYDRLADQFQASIPAIGFAFDVDLLVNQEVPLADEEIIDFTIIYDSLIQTEALELGQWLRNKWYRVIHYPATNDKQQSQKTGSTITCTSKKTILIMDGETREFQDIEEVKEYIKQLKEDTDWNL